jgi:tetratricopeptide (TPR) repeat protein
MWTTTSPSSTRTSYYTPQQHKQVQLEWISYFQFSIPEASRYWRHLVLLLIPDDDNHEYNTLCHRQLHVCSFWHSVATLQKKIQSNLSNALKQLEQQQQQSKQSIENYKELKLLLQFGLYRTGQRTLQDLDNAIHETDQLKNCRIKYYARNIKILLLNSRGSYYNEDARKWELAIRDFNMTIELDPTYAIGYNNRGNSYANIPDLVAAIKDYNVAISIVPDYLDAIYNRSLKLEECSSYIQSFKDAVELKRIFQGYDYDYTRQYDDTIAAVMKGSQDRLFT